MMVSAHAEETAGFDAIPLLKGQEALFLETKIHYGNEQPFINTEN
jgi:hypothetical protein